MASLAKSWQQHRGLWLLILIGIITIYVLVPQIGVLHNSWHLIVKATIGWILIALGLTFLTYLAAAGTYYCLAFKPLRYWQATQIQLAAMFINKLLPAGIGALGANYAYLRHRKHSRAQAASVVGINNIVGVAGHVLLLIITLALFSDKVKLSNSYTKHPSYEVITIMIVILIAVITAIYINRSKFNKLAKSALTQISTYKKHPLKLFGALGASISLTVCNILCLDSCANALNVHLALVLILIIFSLGLALSTAVPTPGGLGGFEAGLFAGFVAYHVPAPSALALALLYRLISYWVPLLLGAPAFIISEKQRLFTSLSD
jgi:uncharacterized membrane protein YbhN (UPF0104 family)